MGPILRILPVEADDIFSDDVSCFSLTSVEISELKDMRRVGIIEPVH